MSRCQKDLDLTMSLHKIKDLIQLKFAKQQTDFITENLETLINNTYSIAPVRESAHKTDHEYKLNRKDVRELTPSISPLEKHWEEAIFRKWEKDDDGLDHKITFRKIVSYQVMLRDTNEDRGWGELDLFGATAENIPVAIELKVKPSEYLLRAVVEVLAYGIAIRKAWNATDDKYSLSSQWAKTVGKIDSLNDLPLVVMAPAEYWQVILSDSPKRIRFQTPQSVRQSIQKLIEKMRRFHYPLIFVKINTEEPLPNKNGLPVIKNAEVIDICSGLKS